MIFVSWRRPWRGSAWTSLKKRKGIRRSGWVDPERGDFLEFLVEAEDLAFRSRLSDASDGRIGEAELRSTLAGEKVQRFREDWRPGHELEFLGIEQNSTDCGGAMFEPPAWD